MSFQLHADLKRDGIPIGKFPLCQVLLINDSAYPWFVLVPRVMNIRDAIDLTKDDYQRLCDESREFGQAIMDAFGGEKLNVAALGNITPQLHVHHVVRFSNDAAWPGPIWGKQPLTPYDAPGIQKVVDLLKESNLPNLEFDKS